MQGPDCRAATKCLKGESFLLVNTMMGKVAVSEREVPSQIKKERDPQKYRGGWRMEIGD